MKYNKYYKSRRKTPWDFKDELTPVEDFIRSNYLDAFKQHHKKLSDTNEAVLLNAYDPTICPYCGSTSFKKNGIYKTNLQKYQCKQCKRNEYSTRSEPLCPILRAPFPMREPI